MEKSNPQQFKFFCVYPDIPHISRRAWGYWASISLTSCAFPDETVHTSHRLTHLKYSCRIVSWAPGIGWKTTGTSHWKHFLWKPHQHEQTCICVLTHIIHINGACTEELLAWLFPERLLRNKKISYFHYFFAKHRQFYSTFDSHHLKLFSTPVRFRNSPLIKWKVKIKFHGFIEGLEALRLE